MKFGLMRDRIDLQRYTSSRDDWGHEVQQWSTFDTVWAEKKYKNSQLTSEVKGITHIMQVIFRIRYRSDVNTKMRVKQGRKLFSLVYIHQNDITSLEVVLFMVSLRVRVKVYGYG